MNQFASPKVYQKSNIINAPWNLWAIVVVKEEFSFMDQLSLFGENHFQLGYKYIEQQCLENLRNWTVEH